MSTKKQITLNEFNAWLAGVEEVQEKGWHPDKKQWRLIRAKIKSIIQTEEPIQYQQNDQMLTEPQNFFTPPPLPSTDFDDVEIMIPSPNDKLDDPTIV